MEKEITYKIIYDWKNGDHYESPSYSLNGLEKAAGIPLNTFDEKQFIEIMKDNFKTHKSTKNASKIQIIRNSDNKVIYNQEK